MKREERNKIYKKILKRYQSGADGGLCFRLWMLNGDKKYRISMFPELMKHKPDVFYTHNGVTTPEDDQFWFPMDDIASRIKILEQAIKETE